MCLFFSQSITWMNQGYWEQPENQQTGPPGLEFDTCALDNWLSAFKMSSPRKWRDQAKNWQTRWKLLSEASWPVCMLNKMSFTTDTGMSEWILFSCIQKASVSSIQHFTDRTTGYRDCFCYRGKRFGSNVQTFIGKSWRCYSLQNLQPI